MRSALTVSLIPEARGGPFVFWEGLEAAAAEAQRLGCDALEIFPPDATALDVAALRALLARHGLRVAAVGTGGGWVRRKLTLTHADPSVRAEARAFIGAIIDVAAALGAPAIIGSMQGRHEGDVSRDAALAHLADALRELGARAARQGQVLLYEPLNRYETNLLNRLADTAAWLEREHLGDIRLLADLFHLNIEEADVPAAFLAAGKAVGHVHFADSNRRAMGFGHTAVGPIMAALRTIGYDGYLSAEVLPLPDSATAAAQTLRAYRAALAG